MGRTRSINTRVLDPQLMRTGGATNEFYWPWNPPIVENYDFVVGTDQLGFTEAVCDDETHPRRFGHYQTGGPLSIRKVNFTTSPVTLSGKGDNGTRRWQIDGVYYPKICWHAGLGVNENLPESHMSYTESLGPSAYNRFKPNKPSVSLSVSIAELRDLPAMLHYKSYQHLNAGKHFLSAQFGWIPFVKDIISMYETYRDIDKVITRITRNNGKWMKRSGTFEDVNHQITYDGPPTGGNWGFFPGPRTDMIDMYRSGYTGVETHAIRSWFTGKFKHYVEGIDSRLLEPQFKRNFIRKLYGFSLTPSDLYQAMPWSWLIDYFSNLGDVIDNINAGVVDTVAKDAWVMSSRITRVTQTSYAAVYGYPEISGVATLEHVSKARNVCNPFGLSLSSSELSGRQLAVLAALGIS